MPTYFSLLIKIFISIAIIVLMIMHMDLSLLQETFRHVEGGAWLWALIFMMGQVFVLAYRWYLFVNVGKYRLDYMTSVRITLASLLANFLLVTSISGLFVRTALTMQYGMSLLKTVCAVVFDRIMTLVALLILAAIFLPALGKYISAEMYQIVCIAFITMFVGGLVLAPLLLSGMFRGLILSHRRLSAGAGYLRSLFLNPERLARIVLSSLVAQFGYFIAVYFIALSVDSEISLIALLTVLPVVAIIASLPIGFGGWGIREGAFIFGFGLIGVTAETAFMISVQIGVLSMASTILVSVPAILSGDARRLIARAVTIPVKN